MIILGGILAFFTLVLIHEAGHFFMARAMGVRVLRFSIGFGKPFFSIKDKHKTQFSVAPIPLGGYVQMLEKDDEENPNSPECFENKPIWRRALIVVAGPLANIILTILLFMALFMIGHPTLLPIIDSPPAGSLADKWGISRGDKIVSINNHQINNWEDVNWQLMNFIGKGSHYIPIIIEKGATGIRSSFTIPAVDWLVSSKEAISDSPIERAGIRAVMPKILTVIDKVVPNKSADKAGVQKGDKIIAISTQNSSINDENAKIANWEQLLKFIQENPSTDAFIKVERANSKAHTLEILIGEKELSSGKKVGFIGIAPQVEHYPDQWLVFTRDNPVKALGKAINKSWQLTTLTIGSLWKIVTRQLSTDHISGPVSVFRVAGDSLSLGISPFLNFLAFFSLSLGILNLLPIPVLDGGHLLLLSFEGIFGRPLNQKAKAILWYCGGILLLGLMAIAIFNDFWRIFED